MDVAEVLARRMQAQRLVGVPAGSVGEVIRGLTCVQSQEHAHALWSVSIRLGDHVRSTAGELRTAFDRGEFLRTHVVRPTWHFVAPGDLGWILRLTAPRVHQRNRSIYRRHGLDAQLLARTTSIMVEEIGAHGPRTRAQLGAALARAGEPVAGDRLAHVVMHAELEQVLVSGPMAGAQHTYVHVADRVRRGERPDDPEAELARRFFGGHGPASVQDFVRWSSLTTTVARAAVGRLDPRLEQVTVAGHELRYDPRQSYDAALDDDRRAWLVPLFDELTLSCPSISFPRADRHPHPPGNDLRLGTVLLGRRNVGLWKRTVSGRSVQVETTLAPGLGRAARLAVDTAVERLARHLELPWTSQ
ncbi:MAG: winged helix DNA-binding domain-containing protein [Propionibacteriaceae bacterium]